jgi:hypothetical protein
VEMFKIQNGEDPIDALIRGIEEKAGSKIFTFKILEKEDQGMKSIIVFEDKRVLYGFIMADLTTQKDKLGLRIQADYI